MAKSYELSEALSRLLAKQPFFAVLIMDLLEITDTDSIPTAATDGRKLFINPEWFNPLGVEERVFVLAHEVMHVILDHCPRLRMYNDRGIGPDLKEWSGGKWNHATDYIINAWLAESKVGVMPVGGLHNPRFTKDDLADDVYTKIPEPPQNQQQGHAQHMPGATNAHPNAKVKRAVAAAGEAAKSQGKMPEGMERLVGDILEPQVKWSDKLRQSLDRVAGNDHTTWSKPNRRRLVMSPHVYWPGKTGYQCGDIVMYEDTSGSISPEELTHFRSEMVGLFSEMHPRSLHVGSCDCEAYDPIEVDDVQDIVDFPSQGGGGTHMPAIFDKLKEHDLKPDALVILTDGWTGYGDNPGYPVFWVITDHSKSADHGETIHLHTPEA